MRLWSCSPSFSGRSGHATNAVNSSMCLEDIAHHEAPSESQVEAIAALKPMIGLAPAR